ncbi:hypothetical protein CARN8_1660002 [mine drainage metagenome]|uniref:Uncharacterized protein n=1 Tax=mine drainage metagenome TaxID=410659 RepID=A0A3P3ZM60_9ZZZZ
MAILEFQKSGEIYRMPWDELAALAEQIPLEFQNVRDVMQFGGVVDAQEMVKAMSFTYTFISPKIGYLARNERRSGGSIILIH